MVAVALDPRHDVSCPPVVSCPRLGGVGDRAVEGGGVQAAGVH